MKLVKELVLYFIMLVVVIMLGSIWNVSTAKELSDVPNDKLISDIDLEITQMRSELLREEFLNSSVSHETLVDNVINDLSKENENNKSSILLEIEKVKAEEKLQYEAKAKAKAEAEAKAKAKAEAEKARIAKELAIKNDSNIVRSKQRINKAEVQQQTFYMESSAYTAGCKGCSGFTSSGYDVRNTIYYNGYRVIAADTSILPLGTVVNIDGVGEAVVLDRGGAIKGNKIDVLVSNTNDAYKYGRKHNVKVTVIGKISY